MAEVIAYSSGNDHIGRRSAHSADIYPAQTFTPESTFDLTSISLLLGRRGTYTGTCSIGFYTTDGSGHPDSFLGSVGFGGSTLTADTWSQTQYQSSTPTSITSSYLQTNYTSNDELNGCTLAVLDSTNYYGLALVTDYVASTGTAHFSGGLDTGNSPQTGTNYFYFTDDGPLATDWKEVNKTGLTFTAGVKYAIVFSGGGAGNTTFPYWGLDSGGGYGGGNQLISLDGMSTWSDLSGDFLFKIYGDVTPPTANSLQLGSAGSFIVAGTDEGVYLSTDFGDTWTRKLPDSVADTNWNKGICSSDGTYIIVVSDADAIYRSANSGSSWAAITPAGGDTFSVNKMATSDDGQYMVIVGQNSTDATESCYISTDYGATWTAKKPSTVSVEWTDCDISNDGTIIGVSTTSYFYISLDSGTTWLTQGLAATAEYWAGFSLSGDGNTGLVANTNDNDEFFIGVKTTLYSEPTWAETALTSAARGLLDDTTQAAQQTTLGLGTGDSPTFTGLTLSSITAEGTDVDKFLVDSTGVIKYRTGTQVLSDIGASASSHVHDGATLQHDGINSDGGAFAFTTSGAVSFSQNIIIPNAGYIGSVSDTSAIQIAANGEVTFTDVVTGVTPTAGVHLATKEYVDLSLGARKTFFLSDTGSGVGSLNYAYPHETGGDQSTIVNDGLGEEYGEGTHLIQGFITETGEPGTTTLHAGVVSIHLHAKKGASNHRTTTLHGILSWVDADGTSSKTTVVTSEVTGELTDTETEYLIHASFGSDIEVASTSRLILDVYAVVGSGAQDAVITLYIEGTEDCFFSTGVDSGIWQNHGDVLDDINTAGRVGADSEFLVGTGANALTWESAATARTSIGLGNVTNVATNDTAYNATSWDANTDAATKNAIRDKVETMDTAIGSNTTHRGLTSGNPHSVTPTELSLVIGTNTQAWDAGLDSLAGLGYVSDSMIKITAEDTYAIRTMAEVRTDLGLVIGTNVQAYDAELTSLAALSYVAASFVKMTGANTFALRTIGETADDLEGTIDHNLTANYDANKHIDHTGVTLTAGTGLTGGGDISANRTFAVDGLLEDLDTLGANSADSEFLVGTGAGALAWESGATARTSLGVGTGDSPTFAGLGLTASVPTLTLKNSDNEHGQDEAESLIKFTDHTDAILAQIQGHHENAADDTKGGWALSTHNGTALTEAIRVDELQRVGVGTSTPGAIFHVHAASADGSMYITTDGLSSANAAVLNMGADLDGTPVWSAIGTWDSNLVLTRSSSLAASPHLVITSAGYVGVGTTPEAIFHAKSTSAARVAVFQNPSEAWEAESNILLTVGTGSLGQGVIAWLTRDVGATYESQLQFRVAAADTEPVVKAVLTPSGFFGVGTIIPSVPIEVVKANGSAFANLTTYHTSTTTAGLLTLRHAGGSEASPSLVDDNWPLGIIHFDGYDGSGWHTGAKIEARIDGAPSDGTDMPTELVFSTCPNGSATLVDRVIIGPDGKVSIGDGGVTNYTSWSATGDQTFTGSAGFYPRFLTQAAEPAAGTGATQCDTSEMVMWKDSDDNRVYLCFNDGGTVKTVELA